MSRPTTLARPPRRMIQHVDAYCPLQRDPIGADLEAPPALRLAADLFYVVWVCPRPALFPNEWAPRLALHITQAGGAR